MMRTKNSSLDWPCFQVFSISVFVTSSKSFPFKWINLSATELTVSSTRKSWILPTTIYGITGTVSNSDRNCIPAWFSFRWLVSDFGPIKLSGIFRIRRPFTFMGSTLLNPKDQFHFYQRPLSSFKAVYFHLLRPFTFILYVRPVEALTYP